MLEARAKFRQECDEIRALLAKPGPGRIKEEPEPETPPNEDAPAMPVVTSYSGGHREKLSDLNIELLGLVARPVKPAEILTNPKARKAVGDEWEKLRKISTWLHDAVREYDEVCAEALRKGGGALRSSLCVMP